VLDDVARPTGKAVAEGRAGSRVDQVDTGGVRDTVEGLRVEIGVGTLMTIVVVVGITSPPDMELGFIALVVLSPDMIVVDAEPRYMDPAGRSPEQLPTVSMTCIGGCTAPVLAARS